MKIDIVLVGVGGQGVLTIAAILAGASLRDGLQVKQGEVHGMSQRGGTVQASLRIADHEIHSDLVPEGAADMVLGMEPVEALRHVQFLRLGGVVVTAAEPFENIPNYPPLADVHAKVRALPDAHLIEAERVAKEAGSPRASNVALVGAASLWLPLRVESLEAEIRAMFARKGSKVVDICLSAFALGREAAACART